MQLPDEIREWPFKKATLLLYILVKAEDGELRYSRDSLSRELEISTQQLRTMLAKLEAEGYVKNLTSKRGSIIQVTNNQPTSNQQVTNRAFECQQVTMGINQQVTNNQPTSNQLNPSPPPSSSPTTSSLSTTTPTQSPLKKESLIEIRKKPPLEERQKKFYDTLLPFLEQYGKEMLREFYDYWSEPTPGGMKFRKELEKTWLLEGRLRRWHKGVSKRPASGMDVGRVLNNEKDDYTTW